MVIPEWMYPVICIVTSGIIIVVALLWKSMFPGIEPPPEAKYPKDQSQVSSNYYYVLRDGQEKLGKKIFGERFDAFLKGGGGRFILFGIVAAVAVLVVSLGYSAGDYIGVIPSPDPNIVGPNDTCVRRGQKLPEGAVIQGWDECNGKVIEPTAIPTILAPTLTPAPSGIIESPTTQIFPSATPIPTEQTTYPIKVVMLEGHPVEQGWMETPSLNGYHQVSEAKCGNPLEVPANTTFAFVLFEGGRDNWLISDSVANVNDAKFSIAGNSVNIEYCKRGSWFSLWVND